MSHQWLRERSRGVAATAAATSLLPISSGEDSLYWLQCWPHFDVLKSLFSHPRCCFKFSDPLVPPPRSEFEEPIPDDRYHGIYFAMLLAGVGFLLPYNSFITDVDYLHDKFKGMKSCE